MGTFLSNIRQITHTKRLRSWIFALWPRASSTNPWVSTRRRWRFLPLDLLGSYSMPRPSPPTPVVLTDWLSTTPALGSGSRLIRTRTRLRRAECILHPLEGTVEPPSPEIVVDGLPGRKVVGQQAPGAAASQDVEDGVYDLTQGVQPGSSGCVRCGQMGLYVRPLFLGEVGRVCLSHTC